MISLVACAVYLTYRKTKGVIVKWILLILILEHNGASPAIDHLEFATQAACEAARARINKAITREAVFGGPDTKGFTGCFAKEGV
jgi:hypothetical protein